MHVNAGQSALSADNAGVLLAPNHRRATGMLIKASLGAGVAWFAYQIANAIASSEPMVRQSPATTIAFLALSLAMAAYIAMRQQAQIAEQSQVWSEKEMGAEVEAAGLVGAIEEASDAVVIADSDGTVRYVNPAFTRMTGYSAGEIVGRNPVRATSDPRVLAFHQLVRETVRAGKVWRAEVPNRRKDGTDYVEEITVTPVHDASGAIRRYIAVRRDVTARHAANHSSALLASIVESSEDAILSGTPDGIILSWNRGAERLYGYRAQEVVGQPVSLLYPPDLQEALKSISQRLRHGESIGHYEAVGLTKNGKRIHISISASPIRDESGKITAHAAIMRDITARVEAQETRALLASIADSAGDAIFGAAMDGTILNWNKAAETLYGYPAADMMGKPLALLMPSGPHNQGDQVAQLLAQVGRGETVAQKELITIGCEGRPVEVSLTMSPVRNAAGTVVGSSAIARDLRRVRQERWLANLANHAADVVWESDDEGQPVFVSPNCERLSGFTQQELCQPGFWLSRIHPEEQARVAAAYRAVFENGQWLDEEYRFLRKDGEWIWLHCRVANVRERDGKRYRDGLLSDITERKRMEQKLAHQATHDPLTGLPNRAVFEDGARQILAHARRHSSMAALLYLDLDRFKRINDTLGHPAGDKLIQLAAQRFSRSMRESEALCRGSGDRFMVALNGISSPQDAVHVAERLLGTLSAPFSVKGNEVFLGASIGVAIYPQHGPDLVSLQRAADSALYAAKRQGPRRIQLSNQEICQAASRRLATEAELHHALERDELSVHYQPQFDLATGRVTGLEALVRWDNPKFGRVPPSVLIPIAEETGLIVPIGNRVLRDACRQGKLWRDAGYGFMQVGVNASAVQFARGDLTATVAATLGETGLEASRLDLEVTESVLMQDLRETARQLRELKKLGVSVSLDDFGTGYSSLSYLEELPIDNLKIDRRFVQRMRGAGNTRTLVESMVGLAHGLGMRAVAEGVETAEQLQQLRAMGCDRAQSFMLGGPAPALSIQALLARQAA